MRVATAHQRPEKAFLKTFGCASCSTAYIKREDTIISRKTKNNDPSNSRFLPAITSPRDLTALKYRLSFRIRRSRTNLSARTPSNEPGNIFGNQNGMMANRSIIAMVETTYLIRALTDDIFGYNLSAVHIRSKYSTVNAIEATDSTTSSAPRNFSGKSKVMAKTVTTLTKINTVITWSNKRLQNEFP